MAGSYLQALPSDLSLKEGSSGSDGCPNHGVPALCKGNTFHAFDQPSAHPFSHGSVDEKKLYEDGNAVLASTEIEYPYMTFDTDLPEQTTLQSHRDGMPKPPNLKPFRDPLRWSHLRKSSLLIISCLGTMVAAYAAGSYTAGNDQMAAEWGVSDVAISAGLTVFTYGFAVAPMVLAPFSEVNGRRPVFVLTGVLCTLLVLCCGLTKSYAGMIICRFLAGCTSSTFATMVGGVVADIYDSRDRNAPMALFTGFAFVGTGLGPLASGFIAYHMSWRWIFYVHAIVLAVLTVLVILFFDETRGNIVLSRKAKEINRWYEAREATGNYGFELPSETGQGTRVRRIRWKVKADEDRASIAQMIAVSLVRPFHLLFTEPVVFFFSLWISFGWAVLYLMFSIIPYAFKQVYDFNLEQAFAVFAALCVAGFIFTPITIWQEKLAIRYKFLPDTPEARLYFACVESALLPIGLFWFGWTITPDTPWIVPAMAITCASMGVFTIYLAVFSYLADIYHSYASSAIAAQSFCRNMLGGSFPLFTDVMFARMTFGGASSFLGGIAVLLTLVPWVLVFYGHRIRARSKFASQVVD